ncbi:MAG TPA: serine/threonine-protein kinase [Planctomycetota bacterium]
MAGGSEILGSDDDICRLLLGKGLIARDKLEKLVRERRMMASQGAILPPLVPSMTLRGLITSPEKLNELQAATTALATCGGCGHFHTILYHVPGSAHVCVKCKTALRPRTVASTSSADPEASLAGGGVLSDDESLLDMGAVKARPAPKPAAPPPSPQESLMGVLPGAGETLLGFGTPAAKAPPPAAPPPPPSPQESLMGLPPGGGETLLDMGSGKTFIPPKLEETRNSTTKTSETRNDETKTLTPDPDPPRLEPTIVVQTASGQIEPTLIADTTPKTKSGSAHGNDPRAMEVTPRSGSAGARSITPTKAAPKEVQEAAKDAKHIFGKYVLTKELGRGGAGVVYKAWDTTLAQYVALKFIRDQELEDSSSGSGSGSQAVADFQKEARMSAKLRHPNIIRIYELGCMSNRYYLSMDYIEGGSLFEVIHDGKDRNTDTTFHKDPKKFLNMFRTIAEAVDSAHTHNPPVIHRDLKPHNVLVDKSGVPFVVDFGLAKEVEMSTDANTMTGVVKGTPSYMAPEQAEGRNKEVDHRTDVYSLGAILYELLTGRPPFQGGSVREVLNSICTKLPDRPNEAIAKSLIEKPDGANRPKSVPKPLETICMKALEKASADRYQSAKDLAEDLRRFLNDEDILAQEPSLYRRIRRGLRQHPLLSAAAAALILCSVAVGAVLKFAPRTDRTAIVQIENAAEEHLKANNWAAMKADAENLRRLDKSHPLADRIEKKLAEHAADLARRRQTWTSGLSKLASGSIPAVLDELRAPFREAGELREEFIDPLDRAIYEMQASAEEQARTLIGSGRREEWLDPTLKATARALRERMGQILDLAKDPDFPFKASAQLAALRTGLDPILAYEGLWDFRVNVAPFARVVLRRGDQVVADEWTPLGLRELEVAGAYTVQLSWPAADKADKTVTLDLKELKHRGMVVLTGDITQAKVQVER